MHQEIIRDSTNYMKMFELLAQASAEYAEAQPSCLRTRTGQHASRPIYILDTPVLEAHIFSLLGLD